MNNLDLRGHSLPYVLYMYLIARRPPKARLIVAEAIDLAMLRAEKMKQLAYVPLPQSVLEKAFHYLAVRSLVIEVEGLTKLIDMGVVLAGMVLKGGEADKS